MVLFVCFVLSCKSQHEPPSSTQKRIDYPSLIQQLASDQTSQLSDSANMLDKANFNPASGDISLYLDSLKSIYSRDSLMIATEGLDDSGILANTQIKQPVSNPDDSFTNDICDIRKEEIKSLRYNLNQLSFQDSTRQKEITDDCRQINCTVWARISKSRQQLYLYVHGELVDSFAVSTGDKKHETPLMNRRPSGPTFQKYTSKKFPGGNYNGLGNMPYAVFVRGGYAIHGTTKGNIPKLGRKASHGCIRLHPDHAKLFFELVRQGGLEQTWVTIEK